MPTVPLRPVLSTVLRTVAAVCAAVAALGACGSRHDAAQPGASLGACRVDGIAREMRCGQIEVPENPDRPDARKLTIHFTVAPASATHRADDAIFVIAGGPGQSAQSVAGMVLPLFESLNARRDVVFIDQRGTGASAPLDCRTPHEAEPLADAFDTDQTVARLHACRDKLSAQGIDLAQYATWIAVGDFDRVRATLGYASVDLWGASYGTRAALEYARQFPSRVRTLVLDGVAPAAMILPASFAQDTDAALDAWAQACAADAHCRARTPDLRASVDALLARAATQPEITVVDPLDGRPNRVPLTREAVIGLLRAPMYVPAAGAVLPYALAQAGNGDYSALAATAAMLGGVTQQGFSEGMHFSVICAEDLPRADATVRAAIASTRIGTTLLDQYARICAGWPVRPVPAAFYAPPKIDAPVLMLSGGIDPATPPRHAQALMPGLPHALHVVAAHRGHGQSGQACGPELIRQFIATASFADLNTDCLTDAPMPSLFAPPGATAPAVQEAQPAPAPVPTTKPTR